MDADFPGAAALKEPFETLFPFPRGAQARQLPKSALSPESHPLLAFCRSLWTAKARTGNTGRRDPLA